MAFEDENYELMDVDDLDDSHDEPSMWMDGMDVDEMIVKLIANKPSPAPKRGNTRRKFHMRTQKSAKAGNHMRTQKSAKAALFCPEAKSGASLCQCREGGQTAR